MLIKIKGGEKNITIPFPTGLVFNSVTAYTILPHIISEVKKAGITGKQLAAVCRELKKAKHLLKKENLPFVEVQTGSGEQVLIKL